MEVVDLIAEGEKVVGRFHCSATNLGPWRDKPSTGRRFERVDEVYIFRIHHGRIAEAWGLEDTRSRERQLGVSGWPRGARTHRCRLDEIWAAATRRRGPSHRCSFDKQASSMGRARARSGRAPSVPDRPPLTPAPRGRSKRCARSIRPLGDRRLRQSVGVDRHARLSTGPGARTTATGPPGRWPRS
jgi:SnoaL-like polyketide cyclase